VIAIRGGERGRGKKEERAKREAPCALKFDELRITMSGKRKREKEGTSGEDSTTPHGREIPITSILREKRGGKRKKKKKGRRGEGLMEMSRPVPLPFPDSLQGKEKREEGGKRGEGKHLFGPVSVLNPHPILYRVARRG